MFSHSHCRQVVTLHFKLTIHICKNSILTLQVAGKYLDHVDEVLLFMDKMAEMTENIPLAAFIFQRNDATKISDYERLKII